jgi:uncharacterized protein (DUF1684 family)
VVNDLSGGISKMNRGVVFLSVACLSIAACGPATTPVQSQSTPATPAAPAVAASPATPAAAVDHTAEVLAWRERRVGNLRKPDGWLSLVGLHWLIEGEQSVGSGEDNAIVLATGPERLGTMRVSQGKLEFIADAAARDLRLQSLQADAWVDISSAAGVAVALQPDSGEQPGRILIGTDSSVTPIERGGKLALRVKDANAATRAGFAGIDYFDIDPGWRIEAQWTAYATPQSFEIQNVLGMIEKMPNPGYASFSRNGREYRLYPVIEEGEADWFFIFADRTSGRETYGPGRFFYATPVADGEKIVLDFNKAYNPPCAFTEYSTCPLPPPENRLDLAVTAGEKKYKAH